MITGVDGTQSNGIIAALIVFSFVALERNRLARAPRSAVRNVVTGCTFVATVPILMTVIAPGLIAQSVDGPLLIASAYCTVAWFTMQGELLDLFSERSAEDEAEFAAMSDEPAV